MDTDSVTALLARCSLYVDVKSQALICRSCKYALTTANSQVTTHLDKKHRVSKDLRLALMRSLRQHLHEFNDPTSQRYLLLLLANRCYRDPLVYT
jgi:hypothetical protein